MGDLKCWYRGHDWRIGDITIDGQWLSYNLSCSRCFIDYQDWLDAGGRHTHR